MSTQPMNEVDNNQGLTCVTTNFLGRICKRCGASIDHMRSNAEHCSRACQKHGVRDAESELRKTCRNIAFAHLNRDRAIGFDGRYEGPLNKPITVVVSIRKDTGYRAMPIDVHVRPIEPKFNVVTPEDHDWAKRQKAFPHTLHMPRVRNSFCAVCAEMVIGAGANTVRVTRGVYLPIKHECSRVRVYDLAGKLLEVKPI